MFDKGNPTRKPTWHVSNAPHGPPWRWPEDVLECIWGELRRSIHPALKARVWACIGQVLCRVLMTDTSAMAVDSAAMDEKMVISTPLPFMLSLLDSTNSLPSLIEGSHMAVALAIAWEFGGNRRAIVAMISE